MVSDFLRIELILENNARGTDDEFPLTCDESGGITIAMRETGPSRLPMLVSPVGRDRFRIEEVHALVDAFRYGDVIEAESLSNGIWRFQKVVEKGRFRQVSLLLSKTALESPQLQEILDDLVAHGGQWERMFGGWLTMAIPYGMPFDPLHRIRELS